MKTWWEQSANGAISAYLCYGSSLPVLEARKKAAKVENAAHPHMFSDIPETVNADDVLETDRRVAYVMRLPYTDVMITRWQERQARLQVQFYDIDLKEPA